MFCMVAGALLGGWYNILGGCYGVLHGCWGIARSLRVVRWFFTGQGLKSPHKSLKFDIYVKMLVNKQ